ncbi:MAG: hypothetical protein ABIN89_10465 [Chitinophagaceae bacterium]
MVGIFKNKNPGNALLLLLYGLFLKFPLFLNPVKPLPDQGDNYIYFLVLRFLEPLSAKIPMLFSLVAFLLFFTQATLLNRIVNSLKLFPKSNYLVGMSFMLVTSLVKEWNSFSAPLLVNSLMIWIWYRMTGLYNNSNAKTTIFNVSVLVGLLPLIYSPTTAFVLLLVMAMIMNRPLDVTEWMVAILGIITPYYFLFVILFLSDQWQGSNVIPYLLFHLPKLPATVWIYAGMGLLLVPFLSGGYFVQTNLNKMLIQVRKAWGLLLWFSLISIIIIFINPADTFMHWMLLLIPVAAFHASTYYYVASRWVASILHWITFAVAVVIQYGLI